MRQCCRNLRVGQIGDVGFAVDFNLVEGVWKASRTEPAEPGNVDHHAVGIDLVDGQAVVLKPAGDLVDIFLGDAEAAEFLGRKPFVEVGRVAVVEFVDQLVEQLLLLRRALKLNENVIEERAVRDRAAVVRGVLCLRARVAGQLHHIAFVDRLRNARRRRDRIAVDLGK